MGAVFVGAICPRGNYVDEKSSERQFSSEAISRGILSGGNYLWTNCLGAIIRGLSSRDQLSGGGGAIILGSNFPHGAIFRGVNPMGAIIHGAIVWGVIFLEPFKGFEIHLLY